MQPTEPCLSPINEPYFHLYTELFTFYQWVEHHVSPINQAYTFCWFTNSIDFHCQKLINSSSFRLLCTSLWRVSTPIYLINLFMSFFKKIRGILIWIFSLHWCLGQFSYQNRMLGWYEQWTFICHSSGGWESKPGHQPCQVLGEDSLPKSCLHVVPLVCMQDSFTSLLFLL